MLNLLLATRLRYYRNFLRTHFDRVTLIEFGFIFLIFIFLALRSPADIGYRFTFLLAPEFPQKWASLWAALLPLFYLIAEIFAFITLRPNGEAQLLGTLPIAPRALLPYYLLRHFLKTFGLIILGAALFLFGKHGFGAKALVSLTAFAVLLDLQLLAFMQAYALRLHSSRKSRLAKNNFARWFVLEMFVIFTLYFAKSFFYLFSAEVIGLWSRFAVALLFLAGLGWCARRIYNPMRIIAAPPLPPPSNRIGLWARRASSPAKFFTGNFTAAHYANDLFFLKREKPSPLWLCGGAIALLLLVTSAQTQAGHAYPAAIFLQLLYSTFMINALMVLFERDGPVLALARTLPIPAAQFWFARWLLVASLLALPALVPMFIIAAKFGVTMQLAWFAFVTWLVLPAIFALLLCNAAFGMFPQTKYAGLVMNIFVVLIVLFWFYMPLGTIILLGFMLMRVRKSQKHFQTLPLE